MSVDTGIPIRAVVCNPANPGVASLLVADAFSVWETKDLAETLDTFRKERCHLIVLDFDIIRSHLNKTPGDIFETISLILCSAPCFVLFNAAIPAPIAESMSDYGIIPFYNGKKSLDKLSGKIRKTIDQHRAAKLEIRWPPGEEEKNTPLFLNKHEVQWVASHLLPEAHKLFVDDSKRRKNSVILRVRVDDLPQPLFLKIGRDERVRKEIKNYSEHIRWRLINTNYAFIEKSNCWPHLDLGGILYTFLGSRHSAETFSQFYAYQEVNAITDVLNILFETLNKGLYSEPIRLQENLYDAYDSYLSLTEMMNTPPTKIEFGNLDPRQWVLANKEKSNLQKERIQLLQSRTHGDLWGENILVEKFGDSHNNSGFDSSHANMDKFQTWLIDFERAGLGHNLRDFVELEVDILTRLAKFVPQDSLYFYELAISLTKSNWIVERTFNPIVGPVNLIPYWTEHVKNNQEAQKAFKVIEHLRASFTTLLNLTFADAREYYWGLLLDSLFLALNEGINLEQRKCAATYASVLAGRLDNWDNTKNIKWPPDGWKNVEFIDRTDGTKKPPKDTDQKEHMV